MITEKLAYKNAITLGQKLPFALVRSVSAFSLGRTPDTLPPEEELLEVRFFSETEEYRIFRTEEGLSALRLTDEADEEHTDRELKLENRRYGEKVILRHCIQYDEDGQAALTSGRLARWEGGENRG